MTLKLAVTTSATGDLSELVLTRETYRVGRRPDNDLRIKETYVSGYHSELRRTDEGSYELVDLGSANGTFLNGDPVETPVGIKAGDFIHFGILEVGVEEHLESLRADTTPCRPDLHEASEDAKCLGERNMELSANVGRLQARLNRESTEKDQLREDLEAAREKSDRRLAEIESLQQLVASKDREVAELEREQARSESDSVQLLKRELFEAREQAVAAEAEAARAVKEKQSLSGSFERLKQQLDAAEAARREAGERESELRRDHGRLSAELEKVEAKNSELAARVKEEEATSLANQKLIAKLESHVRKIESDSLKREKEQADLFQGELDSLRSRLREEVKQRASLSKDLARESKGRQEARATIARLNDRIVELENELDSMRDLLRENEKTRSRLASDLAEKTTLASHHARLTRDLQKELAEAEARSQQSERDMLQKHRGQVDDLLDELRVERDRTTALVAELDNTRHGMSGAIRSARRYGEREKAEIVAAGNARLSETEEELTRAIHSREEIEKARTALEDDLDGREEQIERLSEEVEDLALRLRDENDLRDRILAELRTTREGFSHALHATRGHLERARSSHASETEARERAEKMLGDSQREIDRLKSRAAKDEARFADEVEDWRTRFDRLREENLALSAENGDLGKLRERIVEATSRKEIVESEFHSLKSELKTFRTRHEDLETRKDRLLAECREFEAAIAEAKREFGTLRERCVESQHREEKLAGVIDSAEKRIQSLKKLEREMEEAVERKRRENLVSRNGVFAGETGERPTRNGTASSEEFYRKLIGKLDLLDDLTKRYENTWRYPKVAAELVLLKTGFLDLLSDHSVRAFDLEPGTLLSAGERKMIKLVPLPANEATKVQGNGGPPGENGRASKVLATVRPGYVYRDGLKDIVIRKAEVTVA